MPLLKPLAIFALGCLTALPARVMPPERAPDVLEADVEGPSGPPLWVSAQSAIDQETVLDWDLLARDGFESLRRTVKGQRDHLEKTKSLGTDAPPELSLHPIPASDCYSTTLQTAGDGGDQPKDSLEGLIRHSRAIFRGVVRSVEPGFASGVPSSLLTIDVSEMLRDSGELDRRRIHVAYPVAHFAIGPYHFCNGQTGFEPKAGDKILVFVYFGAIDREGILVNPTLDRIFFERNAGGLFLPETLRKDPGLASRGDLSEVVTLVRERELIRAA